MNGYALFSPSRASPQPPTALLRGRALQCKVQWFKALWLPRVIPFWQQAILTEQAEHPSGSTKPNPFLGEPSGRVPAAQLFLCTGVGQESPFPGITTLLLQVPYSHQGCREGCAVPVPPWPGPLSSSQSGGKPSGRGLWV